MHCLRNFAVCRPKISCNTWLLTMADIFSANKRTEIMKKVRTKDTGCELVVRKMIYGMGYRYRLHKKSLPGKPDIVFGARKKVIFVNGCFWHGHSGCSRGKLPESNALFWQKKIEGNKLRDAKVVKRLKEVGWQSLIIWQCQVNGKNTVRLQSRIKKFIEK